MRNLIIKSILLADIYNKKARKIEFSPGVNFLTSTHNHLGKSSILKSLYHTLGAEALFTESWKQLGIFYCLNFSIDNQDYLITRYKDRYFRFYKNGQLIGKANDISKSLAKILSETYGFTISLVAKDPDKTYTECPPVFYYLPYYIDQENGWTANNAKSFDRLAQFDLDQRRLSYYYHFGVFDAEYTHINARKKEIETKIILNDTEIQNLKMFLQMLRENITDIQASFDEVSLKAAVDKYEADMKNALKTLSETRNEIISLENEKVFLKQDKEVLAKYIRAEPKLEKDSINVTIDNTIECPNCNYIFKKSVAKKLEKQYLFESIKIDYTDLTNKIADLDKKLSKLNTRFSEQEQKVKEIETLITDNTEAYETYQKSKSTRNLVASNENKLNDLKFQHDHLKLALEAVNLLIKQYEEKKAKAFDIFNVHLSKLCMELKIPNSQLKLVYAPGDDIVVAGAYGPRAKVASLLAFVTTKQELATNVLSFPIVIDSPNTLEQDSENLKILMGTLLTLKTGNQLIVASIHGSEIAQNIPGVNIITLKNGKDALLCEEDYNSNEVAINSLFTDI